MKIAFGSDPNATEYKEKMMKYVAGLGHEVMDFGSDDPIYAHVAIQVAEQVAAKEYDRGILFCGTGLGMMLAANKVKGAYAAVVGMCTARRGPAVQQLQYHYAGLPGHRREKAEALIREYLECTYTYNERSGKKVDAILEYEQRH